MSPPPPPRQAFLNPLQARENVGTHFSLSLSFCFKREACNEILSGAQVLKKERKQRLRRHAWNLETNNWFQAGNKDQGNKIQHWEQIQGTALGVLWNSAQGQQSRAVQDKALRKGDRTRDYDKAGPDWHPFPRPLKE